MRHDRCERASWLWLMVLATALIGIPRSISGQAIAAASADDGDQDLALLIELIDQQDDTSFQLDLLRGMLEGLAGRRHVPMPAEWPKLAAKLAESPHREIRQLADQLGLVFGDSQAAKRLLDVIQDDQVPAGERREAIVALAAQDYAPLVDVLLELLEKPRLRAVAIRQLAGYDQLTIADRLLQVYPGLEEGERHDVIMTLVSRRAYAMKLIDAMDRGVVPRSDVSAYAARQMVALGEPVRQRLGSVWGAVQSARPDRAQQMATYRRLLEAPGESDASRGRSVFERTCQKCHRLFDQGETIGPDLTGTNRVSLEYLLENVIDPNALIGKDYQLYNIVLEDGRLVSGIVVGQDSQAVRVRTVNESLVIARDAIDVLQASPTSMMPEGQLEELTRQEVRDLFAYLQSPGPVPVAASRSTAADSQGP